MKQDSHGPGYTSEEVWLPFSEGIMEWNSDFHSLMLNDQVRMRAYSTAIAEAVKPGMTVLDLGTGTGILALWALQAGAARVYGIDVSADILSKAVDRITKAGYASQFQVFNSLSFEVQLPERVDLIISEIMGNIGDNEDFVPILADARRRFLKQGGAMLPEWVTTYLVPVAADKAHGQLRAGQALGGAPNLSLDEMVRKRPNSARSRFDCYYDVILPRSAYLSTPHLLRRYAMDGTDTAVYEMSLAYTVHRDGAFTGFKGYFLANLSRTVCLDISGDDIPGRTTSDSWKHCYLPIEQPIPVIKGDRIALSFSRGYPKHRDNPFQQVYCWQGEVWRGRELVARFAQDMGR